MAKKKSAGQTRLGRDSEAKRLGVKKFGGEKVKPGQVIIKQRGTKFLPGKNVRKGNDDTLYAAKQGRVSFKTTSKTRFDGTKREAKLVEVK